MPEHKALPKKHDGNWYILVAGLDRPEKPLTLGPGLSLIPLQSPLSVFDLAAAGAVGFREWAVLEPVSQICMCEIESAKNSDVVPGYDTLNRAWLVSALLVLRGFGGHLGVACSSYSWNKIAGHQKRTSHIFREQLETEGVRAAIFRIPARPSAIPRKSLISTQRCLSTATLKTIALLKMTQIGFIHTSTLSINWRARVTLSVLHLKWR